MSREIAREVVMKLIYSELLGGCGTPEQVLEESNIDEPLDSIDLAYVARVRALTGEHLASIDETIANHAVGWALPRIARVDLAILRVALCEMRYMDDIPQGASINEAVELAKRFGGERSYAFINGILGAAARAEAADGAAEEV